MIGAGKNGPPGKYKRWLSGASTGPVGFSSRIGIVNTLSSTGSDLSCVVEARGVTPHVRLHPPVHRPLQVLLAVFTRSVPLGYGSASSGSASDGASDDDLVNRYFTKTFPPP
ncbi:hypothetical protein PIB30_101551 [Stylosanthes scabra]|uniref:Uncharacterized protein n=1 Tax=Stylosanthes scabra TaxID=79078 RepID=A0ABU6QYZ7_9FABA|nr:hypothetical protein [Stylosanthes scabra]